MVYYNVWLFTPFSRHCLMIRNVVTWGSVITSFACMYVGMYVLGGEGHRVPTVLMK